MHENMYDTLVCPICHGRLIRSKENELICKKDSVAYPIINGVPVLIVERARSFNKGDIND